MTEHNTIEVKSKSIDGDSAWKEFVRTLKERSADGWELIDVEERFALIGSEEVCILQKSDSKWEFTCNGYTVRDSDDLNEGFNFISQKQSEGWIHVKTVERNMIFRSNLGFQTKFYMIYLKRKVESIQVIEDKEQSESEFVGGTNALKEYLEKKYLALRALGGSSHTKENFEDGDIAYEEYLEKKYLERISDEEWKTEPYIDTGYPHMENLRDTLDKFTEDIADNISLIIECVKVSGEIDWDLAWETTRSLDKIIRDEDEKTLTIGMLYRFLSVVAKKTEDGLNWWERSCCLVADGNNFFYFSMITMGGLEGFIEDLCHGERFGSEQEEAEYIESGIENIRIGVNKLRNSEMQKEYLAVLGLVEELISHYVPRLEEAGFNRYASILQNM